MGRFSVDGKSSLDSMSGALSKTSSTRITFINSNSDVLGDSDKDPARMENHTDRPEFKDAIDDKESSLRFLSVFWRVLTSLRSVKGHAWLKLSGS